MFRLQTRKVLVDEAVDLLAPSWRGIQMFLGQSRVLGEKMRRWVECNNIFKAYLMRLCL